MHAGETGEQNLAFYLWSGKMTSRGHLVNMCDEEQDLCVSDYLLQQCSVLSYGRV